MNFRKNIICPISKEKIIPSKKNIGCSNCLNVFKEDAIIKWLNIKYQCPFKCENNVFCSVINWKKKDPQEIFI